MADLQVMVGLPWETGHRDDIAADVISYTAEEWLNRPGSFSLTCDNYGAHMLGLRTNLDIGASDLNDPLAGRSVVHIVRDGTPIFGGPVWTVTRSGGSPSVDVRGEGYLSHFRHRHLQAERIYTAEEQFEIVDDLLTTVQAAGVTHPTWNLAVGWDSPSGQTVTITYPSTQYQEVAQVIVDLAEGLSGAPGFDFKQVLAWSGANMTRTLKLYYPTAGVVRSDVLDLYSDDAGLGRGTAESIGYAADATKLANLVIGLGAGSGPSGIRVSATDATAQLTWPYSVGLESHRDVTTSGELQRRTNADLKARKYPSNIPAVTTDPTIAAGWDLGDTVTVRIEDGYTQLSGSMRMIGRRWEMDVERNERVTPMLANPLVV